MAAESPEFLEFAVLQPGLTHSIAAAWVIDPLEAKFVWANAHALELWKADSLEELCARELAPGTPKSAQSRIAAMGARLRAGEVVEGEWTFMPRGEPLQVSLVARGVMVEGLEFAVLFQVAPLLEASAYQRRASATFDHSAQLVSFVRANGELWMQNPAALVYFGEQDSWLDRLADPERGAELLRQSLADERGEALLQVHSLDGLRWHQLELVAVRDPVSGEIGLLINHSDESSRVEAERIAADQGKHIEDLRAALVLVEQQRREILELSAPLLEVAPFTLAVPLVGRFDEEQAEELSTKLLERVRERGIRRVIIDLTGSAALDEGSAGHLQRVLAALRLLGAEVSISGVSPASSLAMTRAGIELEGTGFARSLAQGLRLRG